MISRFASRFAILMAAASVILLTSPRSWADYPIMSHRYLADPGSLVFNGRVYLYNSNDDDNAEAGGYTMHSIVCVSSADLKNWTDHGIVFQVPADASWANYSWAPQPIERSGTIFLYFGNNASGVGVATSTDPTGGFKDAKGSYLVNSSTPGASGTNSWLFDPGAFIDDDGQAYLSFGGNGADNGRIIKLGSNLVSVSGSAVGVSTTSTAQFFEASFLFKRNNIYYLAYSTNPSNGQRIDYLMSSSPMTGYTYGGTIGANPPSNGNNNHASEFEFNGSWYHAYHNRTVSTQAGISTTYKRNLALEVLSFNSDGTIKQVTYTTNGVPQVGNLNPYVRVEAETMNAQSGIETETCTEGGMDVTQIGNGDWVAVRGVDFGTAGAASFSARVASAAAGGSIELRLGSATGTLIGTCSVPATGGAQTWSNVTCNVAGATGVKDLYLKFTGSGSFNFNYWQFTPTNGGNGGTGGASSTGGGPATGGSRATGGTSSSAGGSATGGLRATGGASAAGGTRATGGAPSAGGTAAATGGNVTATGGAALVGGTTSTGVPRTGGATSLSATGGVSGDVTGGRSSTGGVNNAAGGLATTGGSVDQPGASGSPALGGTSNSGGFLAATGGLPASAMGGQPSGAPDSTNEGSCSCRVPAHSSNSKSLAVFAVFGWLTMRPLRRRLRCG
jgi:arabinoxylan arabinofuranohydrolase